MFESIMNKIKKITKKEDQTLKSKDAAKERLHLVLMQDRANVSADFLDLMKQEIIEVIKKYIDIDEKAIDVRLTNKEGEDGKVGAPALYANIPIITIKNEARKLEGTLKKENKEKVEDATTEETKNDNSNEKETTKADDVNNEENKELDSNLVEVQTNTASEEPSNTPKEDDNKNLEEVDNEKKDS